MRVLTADHVLPISSAPLKDGAVVIDGSTIIRVGPAADVLREYPKAPVERLGEAAILPGFVNCHSHLEITGMRGALDAVEHDFTSWLLKLNGLRAAMSEDDIKTAAVAGALEGAQAGVTCFGDIGRMGFAGLHALKTAGLRGVLYQETEFSADNRSAKNDFEKLKAKFFGLRDQQTELVEVGLSPHSPYTVSRQLFEKIARFALDENVKLSVHAAESIDEDELLRRGEGYFRSLLDKYEVEWASPNCSSIEYLSQTGILETKPLLAHCITVTDDDIEVISRTSTGVAHCPKSNAKFGHGYAPFEKMRDAGVAVGLGSDSVASNNVCDILEESRFAALAARNHLERKRFVSAGDVLEAATLGGARAMRLDDKIGSLEVGKQADIAVVSLSHPAQKPVTDVESALVFSSNARDVLITMVGGTEIFRSATI